MKKSLKADRGMHSEVNAFGISPEPYLSSPKVFYVGNFQFPDGDAGSHRVYGVGKALDAAGYQVTFLGSECSGRPQDAVLSGGYEFQGFPYYPAGGAGKTPLSRAMRLWHSYVSGATTISRLKALWSDNTVAVIAYQASSPLLARLRRFCNQRNAVLIADIVEWYDRHHITWGRFGPFALDSELRMRYVNRLADGIIAISSYLERYYNREGKRVIRVPALVDMQAGVWRRSLAGHGAGVPLQLAFVGRAGQKDMLVNAIRGLSLIGDDVGKLELVMVGPTRAEVARGLGEYAILLDRLSGNLRFVGQVSHHEALAYLRQADFSIVLRPDLRFAQAGFPTKLVESLAMGVPVICNLTSDIGMYVRDGREGIVVKGCSPEAFAFGLRRALSLSMEKRSYMRIDARQRAEACFDYREWSETVRVFMRSMIPGSNVQ